MTMATSPQGDDRFNVKSSMNLLYLVASAHATCFTVFLRRGFGTEALGLNGIIALVIILLYAGETRDPYMAWYFWAWLLALIAQRLDTFLLVRKGNREHSRYDGWPNIALALPFVKTEAIAKNLVEPLMCFLGGVLLCPLSESLGGFVMLGFFSLVIKRGLESQANRMQVQRLRDAEIEQRQLAERFRGQSKDY